MILLRQINDFELGRPFGPWMYRILINRGLNARKSRALRRTEILPFHQMGRYKWKRLGIDYTLDNTEPAADAAVDAAAAIFREAGLSVH